MLVLIQHIIMLIFKWLSFIFCYEFEISNSQNQLLSLPSFRAQSRNLPCTLLLLAPFAKGFPFSAITHTAIYTIPSFRAQREILFALCYFLLLSLKVSPFPLSHIRHYPLLQERSLDFARDDVAEVAFSQHILYTGRGLSIPPYRHFERSEKSSLHSALSCSFRKRFPLFRCLTQDAILVCKKDRGLRSG